MNQTHITRITAVARVDGAGQKITEVVLEYDRDLTAAVLPAAAFEVKNRTLLGEPVVSDAQGGKGSLGRFVTLPLNSADPAAATFHMGEDGQFGRFVSTPVEVEVRQASDIPAADGSTLPAFDFIRSTEKQEDIVAQFTVRRFHLPGSDRALTYNLYVPAIMGPDERYPLVVFMHDASTCADDPKAPLIQGNGATVWAQDAENGVRPCFVLVPSYDSVCANDDFQVTWAADATVELIKSLALEYMNINTGRIYATGQSMGCMMICELMLRNPGFFAGTLLIGGQWNPETMAGAKDENIWAVVSQGDQKAYPILGACFDAMAQAGEPVVKAGFDAAMADDAVARTLKSLEKPGCHLYFTYAQGDSILPAGSKAAHPGLYHISTWKKAYGIEALRAWLFAQRGAPLKQYTPVDAIDFSCKHDILLESEDGTLTPLDQPYFKAKQIADGTWQILSDGDFSYLLEGDYEALLIDSGYGAGNIRAFCGTLTRKPVRRIANTHDHFDHTANNAYFYCAYMSEETRPLATVPFPSFEGIDFPRDYPVVILDDNDVIPLQGRDLLVLKIPDHAVGSLVFLDRRERILFSGDELGMPMGKPLNRSVANWCRCMEKLMAHRHEFDTLCTGGDIMGAELVEQYLENARHILAGGEGAPAPLQEFPNTLRIDEQGRRIWKRRLPHPGDGPKDFGKDNEYKRVMDYSGCKIIYDTRKIDD